MSGQGFTPLAAGTTIRLRLQMSSGPLTVDVTVGPDGWVTLPATETDGMLMWGKTLLSAEIVDPDGTTRPLRPFSHGFTPADDDADPA